jgi:hypothetical protein
MHTGMLWEGITVPASSISMGPRVAIPLECVAARLNIAVISSVVNFGNTSTLHRDNNAPLTSNDGFSVGKRDRYNMKTESSQSPSDISLCTCRSTNKCNSTILNEW